MCAAKASVSAPRAGSATVCQSTSAPLPSRRTSGLATNVPLPGSVCRTPALTSWLTARETVTGPTRSRCEISRLDGIGWPGRRCAASVRSSRTTSAVLLLSAMKLNSSAITSGVRPLPGRSRRPYAVAAGWGLLGVVAFSVTLPATRAAVPAFGPVVVGLGRAVVAAALAGAALLITRAPRPARSDWPSLAIVAAGVVVGFPLLSALALGIVGSAHAAVFVALLPLATAVAAVVRAGERPSVLFWVLSVLGAALTIGFALVQGAGSLGLADLLMLGAVVAAGFGYADGAILSRRMPSWRVIAWALVVSAPVMAVATAVAMAMDPPRQVTGGALLGMA